MNNEQIAQEIRELNDHSGRHLLELEALSERLLSLERRPFEAPAPDIATRLAGHDRMIANYGAELGVLADIVARLADRLTLLEKGWE